MMTGKERIYAALDGSGSPDDIPMILHDTYGQTRGTTKGPNWHVFGEGKPWWIMNSWEDRHWDQKMDVEAKFQEICDIDWVWDQPGLCPSREWRETHRVVETRGGVYMASVGPPTATARDRNVRGGRGSIMEEPEPDGSTNVLRVSRDVLKKKYGLDMLELIKGKEDIERYIVVEKAEELIESGKLDWVKANVERFGEDKFMLVGNDRSAAGSAASLLGHTTYLKTILRNPKLIKQITDRFADRMIEQDKAYAKMGADGTCDWEWVTGQYISPAHWDEFVKPYTTKVMKAARKIGFKIMYGTTGVGREWTKGLESMLEMPLDAIALEEDLKGMYTELSWQSQLLKDKGLQDKIAILGNVPTVAVIKDGSSAELEREIKRQVDIGRDYGKFIMSPGGAPITPDTTYERVVEYCKLARKYGRRKQ
jgi:uroporphyrinogen-III decarboxylase